MKKLLFVILFPTWLCGQIVHSDDFSDGNFTSLLPWSGDDSLFEVNLNNELHLNDNISRKAYLSTPSALINNASWEFYTRMEFNPSSSNYCKVYLVSDQADLNNSLNGYYVRLGGSSADRISLYKQTGSSSSLVAESSDDWLDVAIVEVGIKVTRDSTGFWVLSADTSGGTNYQVLDSALESSHFTSSFFGVACTYTSTRADKMFFDNFYWQGEAFVDNKPAAISSVEVISTNILEIEFSESLEKTSAETISNYQVDGGIGNPQLAKLDPVDNRLVTLTFSKSFVNRQVYKVNVNGVEDLFSNITTDSALFSFYHAEAGDVVINELMVDPNPVIGIPPNALPEREYIELYNRTNLPIQLENWILTAGTSVEVLPPYLLTPNGFVVITKDEGVNEFPPGLPILGLDMSSVALTNSGNTVSLKSPQGSLISTVSYTDDWYNDANKDNGGWSLEQIDPDNNCGGSSNWTASTNTMGGTPGAQNSVFGSNPDTTEPAFMRISITGDSSLVIYFTETVQDSLLIQISNYRIEPSLQLDSVKMVTAANDAVELFLAEAIDPQVIYHLSLFDYPHDCSNNLMKPDTLMFTIPAVPLTGEILINEVLFNPPTGGSDFVEIYNNSDKIFDLSKLRLANVDPDFGTPTNVKMISDESFLFEPGRYMALSYDVGFLASYYIIKVPENLLETTETLPTMNDNEGTISVYTSDLQTQVDYLEYDDDMQLAVLKDADGVSLERISHAKPTADKDNWQSAASTAGYATPGYLNSQNFIPQSKGEISVQPKVFSPNQDGYNDILTINYDFKNPNNMVTLSIWTSEGFPLVQLQEAVNVGQQGFFTWDGTDSKGQLANSGIYIVVVEYFNQNGDSEVLRVSCVLSL